MRFLIQATEGSRAAVELFGQAMDAFREELDSGGTGREEFLVAKEAGRIARRALATPDGSVRVSVPAAVTATNNAVETRLSALETAVGQVAQAVQSMTSLVSSLSGRLRFVVADVS